MACVGSDSPCFIAGDDLYYPVEFKKSDGEPWILTGATAKMDMRESATSATVTQSMTGGITSAVLGQMAFTLTDTETAALLPRAEATKSFVFSVKLTYSDGTPQTIMTGTLTLEQAATA